MYFAKQHNGRSKGLRSLLSVMGFFAVFFFASAISISAATLFAVTVNNDLVSFSDNNACSITSSVGISGLQADEAILAIDFRPANGQLYGLGSTSRIYVLDTISGVATEVGSGPFTPALSGNSFGFDFNPTVDRIRIVSNTGQNLRAHPVTGAIVFVDTSLAFAATDVNFGATPSVIAAAYTNPDNDPGTGTTLFDLDSALNILVSQVPPNNGTLNTIGPLGANINSVGEFDISSSNVAYMAVIESGQTRSNGRRCGTSSLASVNLMSGAGTMLGAIGTRQPIRGLAVQLP